MAYSMTTDDTFAAEWDLCMVWLEDGEAMQRLWRDFYNGDPLTLPAHDGEDLPPPRLTPPLCGTTCYARWLHTTGRLRALRWGHRRNT